GSNTDAKTIFEDDDLKKQKRKNRMRKSGPESTWSSIWKSLTAPNIDKLLQKSKFAYEKNKLKKVLDIYTQILRVDPTNYVILCNRAKIKLDVKIFEKVLFDLETAIGVNKVYNDAWYLSLMAHVGLENRKEVEHDIGHIKHLDIQGKAFDLISEYVNKLEHFDVEWFKILVNSCCY